MQTPDLKVSCQIKGLALQEAQYEQPDILNWPALFYEKKCESAGADDASLKPQNH